MTDNSEYTPEAVAGYKDAQRESAIMVSVAQRYLAQLPDDEIGAWQVVMALFESPANTVDELSVRVAILRESASYMAVRLADHKVQQLVTKWKSLDPWGRTALAEIYMLHINAALTDVTTPSPSDDACGSGYSSPTDAT